MRTPLHLQMPLVSAVAVSILVLLPARSAADGKGPAPRRVAFGPNVNLSVENNFKSIDDVETTAAANPLDPLNLVVGNIEVGDTPGQSCSFSFTRDGGRTWTRGGLVPTEGSGDFVFDPALAADADGTFYYAYVDAASFHTAHQKADFGRADLLVAKSTDGGRTFPTVSVALDAIICDTCPFLADKDYIAIDTQPGSPFKGDIYVAFTNEGVTGYQTAVVVSRDAGRTWSDPQLIGGLALYTSNAFNLGALPVVAPDGTVYIFYMDVIDFTSGPMNILFSKSTDGGRTWSRTASVASNLPSPGQFFLKNSDPKIGAAPFIGLAMSSLPTAAIAPDGTLFVSWVDFPNGSCLTDGNTCPLCLNSDVRLSVSRNGGKTWSRPVKVSDDRGSTDQFNPWIAVHPDGLLSLFWLDKRLDPKNENYDVFYTNTFDGSTFLPNVRISTATSLTGNGLTFVGDYNVLATTADGIFPVWSDMRSGNPDVYAAAGRFVP
ncbi:MAG TPA: sialidase family protein [Candidatus Polarisedimenticolia bacterium]|nr:sialidase family protein [Candidatus Polarisedimenticolia bacterium]